MRPTTLGDLVERVTDRVEAGSARGAFVGLEHIVPDQLRLEGRAEAAEQRSAGLAFRRGDLLFGALRPGFRKVVVAPCDGVGSAELLVLRPRAGEHPGFVLAWLSHPDTVATCVAKATGTRMPRVRWSELASLARPLPDRPVRRGIGVLAERFQARLALLHRRGDTSAALLRAVVARHAGPDGPRVGDVARPRARDGATTDDSPVLSVADLPGEGLAVHTWGDDAGRSAKHPVRRGDVLVSRLRPALRKSAICPVDGVASPEIIAWETDARWRGVLAGRVLDRGVQDGWIAHATGTRMPRVPVAVLADTRLGVPDEVADRLAPALEPLVEHIVGGVHLGRALRGLRDRVLRDLLDGALDPTALADLAPEVTLRVETG